MRGPQWLITEHIQDEAGFTTPAGVVAVLTIDRDSSGRGLADDVSATVQYSAADGCGGRVSATPTKLGGLSVDT
jgi:hypothetical protein